MDQCESMMKNPLAKCLYWGFILLLLLVVIYHLRNPAEYAIGTLESCAHGECKNLQKSNKLFVNDRVGEASVTNTGFDYNEEPFKNNVFVRENFKVGELEGCAHGQCKRLYNTNTLFRHKPLGFATITNDGYDYNEEPFKLPPGSDTFKNVPEGPSRESMLDVEQFSKAGSSDPSSPLIAALEGGSAMNYPPGSLERKR